VGGRTSVRVLVAIALAVAVGLAAGVAPFASSSPDGLEKVAAEQGFGERAELHAVQEQAPIRDYAFPGIEDERFATGLAGFLGTLLVFGFGSALALTLRRRRPDAAPA
jgi:hypothetical protein